VRGVFKKQGGSKQKGRTKITISEQFKKGRAGAGKKKVCPRQEKKPAELRPVKEWSRAQREKKPFMGNAKC